MTIDLAVILSVILLVIIAIVFSGNLAQHLRIKYRLDIGGEFALFFVVLYFGSILIAVIVKVAL